MATLTHDHGKLLLDFFWQGVRCREYLGGDAGDKAAEREARKLRAIVKGQIASGSLDYASMFPKSKRVRPGGRFAPPPPPAAPEAPPTFRVFAEAWLQRQRGCEAYLADLRSMLDVHLFPRFGSRLLGAILVEDVETLMVDLRHKGLGPVRCNKVRALLSRLLERGVRSKLAVENVVADVKAERGKKPVVDPLSFQEVKRFVDVGLAGDAEMQRFYTFKFFSGVRTCEALGLRWEDLDLRSDRPTAAIRRSVTKADGVHVPKTVESERVIDLRPQALRAIREQRAAAQLRSDYVFPSAVGGPLDRDNLASRVWKPGLKRAGLRLRGERQSRHTFASLALGAGEAPQWVQTQMGHTNVATVFKCYARFIPDLTRRDGSALDKAAAEAGL